MADFAVLVRQITKPVEDHPNADRLSLVKIDGYTCIANKLEDGTPRYKAGDYVVYVPEGALVPEYLLRPGFWNEKTGKGILAGKMGNRVKAIKLRDIVSQGILFPVIDGVLRGKDGTIMSVSAGDDVAEFLGIEKYVPEIPQCMNGKVTYLPNGPLRYDIESIQAYPNLFEIGENIIVTEKLHGTLMQVGYIPGANNPLLFGKNGDIFVTSKGMGNKGLVFTNCEDNDKNIYVQALKKMLDDELEQKLIGAEPHTFPLNFFFELFGPGVQDLQYGEKERQFALFDIAIGGNYVTPDILLYVAEQNNFALVPALSVESYQGIDSLIKYRDGKDTISGSHVREGIVVRSVFGPRKILKFVSPDYLLRKGNVTEFS